MTLDCYYTEYVLHICDDATIVSILRWNTASGSRCRSSNVAAIITSAMAEGRRPRELPSPDAMLALEMSKARTIDIPSSVTPGRRAGLPHANCAVTRGLVTTIFTVIFLLVTSVMYVHACIIYL